MECDTIVQSRLRLFQCQVRVSSTYSIVLPVRKKTCCRKCLVHSENDTGDAVDISGGPLLGSARILAIPARELGAIY